jgi:hypothetical protein
MRMILPALSAASLCFFSASIFAQSNACDLNSDGVVNVIDVQLATDLIQGIGTLMCTFTIGGSAVFCNPAVVSLIINAALGAPCTHYITLGLPAITSSNVVGYNVYRGSTTGGPYTILNTSLVTGTSYTDVSVAPGTSYYYVATAVSGTGTQSSYSNQVQATTTSP